MDRVKERKRETERKREGGSGMYLCDYKREVGWMRVKRGWVEDTES